MSAPWPYEDEPPAPDKGEPTWHCPDEICQCHAVDVKTEPKTFSVLLRDHTGRAMAGARCRVFVGGRLANEETPYADGEGRLTVDLSSAPTRARVEWAPQDTPLLPIYPYRKSYFVELREHDHREAARRRLHNLGFGHWSTLDANVRDFQRDNGYPSVNGRLDEIEEDLRRYHDDGVPPTPPASEADGDEEGAI